MTKLMVRAEIDEVAVLRVRAGQVVGADATGVGGAHMTGKVVRVGLIMGRKRLVSNDPREKVDTKVLEVLVELDGKPNLPVGYRVTVKCEGDR
jgi:HlyD family secretion protein